MKENAANVSVAVAAQAMLGEGALWDDRTETLLWVDILSRRVSRWSPATGRFEHWTMPSFVGTVVPTRRGHLLVALQDGVHRLDGADGTLQRFFAPAEHDAATTRFNDGKCDPSGRFWAGTMSLSGQRDAGALYCFETPDRSTRRVAPVSISNGLAWDVARGRMYYVDTPRGTVDAFAYDVRTGALGERTVAVRIPPELGYPDGMTIDTSGHLWVALWDGGAVVRCDPTSGRIEEIFRFPASKITSCAFGGPDRRTLYVTSARTEHSAEELARQPRAGDIFSVRVEAEGCPTACFAD